MSGVGQVFRVGTGVRCGLQSLILDALLYTDDPDYRAIIFSDSYRHLISGDGPIRETRRILEGLRRPVIYDTTGHSFEFPNGAVLSFSYFGAEAQWTYRYSGAVFQFIAFETDRGLRGEQYRYMYSRLRRLRQGPRPLPLRMAVLFDKGRFDGCDWLHSIPSTGLTVSFYENEHNHLPQGVYI